MFNIKVFEKRIEILIELLKTNYNADNIGTQAVIDTAKMYAIAYNTFYIIKKKR